MALSLRNNTKLTYQDACEFLDYRENKKQFQNKIKEFEVAIAQHCVENNKQNLNKQIRGETEGAVTHDFADGQYIRKIVMPAGLLVTTKIHAKNHPYFILSGKVSIYSDKGVDHIEAPHHGITEAGTKRVLYVHEECTFITVHRTDCLNVDDIVNEVVVDDFAELKLEGFDIKQIDKIMENVL